MPQLHTKCKWFSFAFVESRYAVATRTEASTSYRRENGKRPTTPSCRRPFGETPENNKRRRYAGRRTVFPSVRTDPPESTPLTPLCGGCCFPLGFIMHKGLDKCNPFSFRNVRKVSPVKHLKNCGVERPGLETFCLCLPLENPGRPRAPQNDGRKILVLPGFPTRSRGIGRVSTKVASHGRRSAEFGSVSG